MMYLACHHTLCSLSHRNLHLTSYTLHVQLEDRHKEGYTAVIWQYSATQSSTGLGSQYRWEVQVYWKYCDGEWGNTDADMCIGGTQ